MDCREFLHRYSDYDDSLISAREADRFRAHMAGCASCARYDRILRKGRMLARQLPSPGSRPDFMPRLQLRLLQTRSGHAGRGGFPGARLATGLAATTVLMVAVSAAWLLDASPGLVAGAPYIGVEGSAEPGPPPPGRLTRLAMVADLGAAGPGEARAWAVKKVAPAEASSYSPLVTGPPVYRRGPPSSPGTTDSDRRALD